MVKQVKDRGYALDLLNPARHLRTMMDAAAGAAVSVRAVAQTYVHPNPGDLSRVKRHEKRANEADANFWMIEEAAREMSRWLSVQEVDGEVWVSLKTNARTDQLKIFGMKVLADTNPHAVFGDPFDPNREFAVNVRVPNAKDDTTELEESMRLFGWVEELPAIQDERGVLLMGHRRMAVAKKLGIEPVIKTIEFGKGDQADAKRLGIALASNMGGKPFTAADRRRIAAEMYQGHEYDPDKIAEMLKVSKMTVFRDLKDSNIMLRTKRGQWRKKSPVSEPSPDPEPQATVPSEPEPQPATTSESSAQPEPESVKEESKPLPETITTLTNPPPIDPQAPSCDVPLFAVSFAAKTARKEEWTRLVHELRQFARDGGLGLVERFIADFEQEGWHR